MKISFFVVSALAAGVVMTGAAHAQAGFDCDKAKTATERAICANEELAEADRAMSVAYKALIGRADAPMKKALMQDQQDFLQLREEAFESHVTTPENRLESLLLRTEMRAEFLNWISTEESSSLIGTWRNAWGIIEVTPKGVDGMYVDLNIADQAHGSWLCSFEENLSVFSPKRAIFDSDAGPLELVLEGSLLIVPTPFCDESTSGGFGGSAKGTYFRVGAED